MLFHLLKGARTQLLESLYFKSPINDPVSSLELNPDLILQGCLNRRKVHLDFEEKIWSAGL